jgi:hypothetical protein
MRKARQLPKQRWSKPDQCRQSLAEDTRKVKAMAVAREVVAEMLTQGLTTCNGMVAWKGAGGLKSIEEGKRNLEPYKRKREKRHWRLFAGPRWGRCTCIHTSVWTSHDKYARVGRVR